MERRDSMKFSKGLKWFSALLVTTSVLSTTVPVTAAPFSLFGSKEQLSDEDIQKIQEVYRSIREGYIEEIDKEKILEGALKGMVSATEDPYSEYFNKEESNPHRQTGPRIQLPLRGGRVQRKPARLLQGLRRQGLGHCRVFAREAGVHGPHPA